MLAVNGVPYTNLEKDSKIKVAIMKALNLIKNQKQWAIKFHESQIRPPKPGERQLYETSAGILLKATQRYPFDGMEHDVTYYTSSSSGANGIVNYHPNFVDYNGTKVLDSKTQADFIFFLICVSGKCAHSDLLEKYQREPVGNPVFRVENLVLEAATKNEIERKIAKVRTLIYDDEIGIKEKTLREIAISYGIANAEDVHREILMHDMVNYVLQKEFGKYNMNRVNEFLSDVEDISLAKVRGAVKIAIKDGLIKTSTGTTGRVGWYYTDDKNEAKTLIMTTPKGSEPEDALVKHLYRKQEEQEEFIEYVNAGKKTPTPKKKTGRPHVIRNVE